MNLKEKANVLIVSNSMKSIMPCNVDGIYKGIPNNEKITIIGLKTENGKLLMAFHKTIVTKEPFEKLSFKPVTIATYKNRLEKLNTL